MSQSTKTLHSFGSLEVDGQGLSNKGHVVELTEATTLTAAQSNTTFFLNSATEFAVTLPPAATAGAGWKCRVYCKAAPSGADYTVVTSDTTNIYGQVVSPDLDAVGNAGFTAGTGVGTITFADGKAVQGDYVDILCDGSDFYCTGFSSVFDGIAL
jgi:hypothetical protein